MKQIPKLLSRLAIVAVLASFAAAQHSRPLSAGRISVVGTNPFRLHIETTGPVTPQIQMVSSPDRLVIDLPNAAPGIAFHGVSVQREGVRGVRTGIFSTSPLVSRVVVDLTSPQWYQVAPDSSGLLVTLGSGQESTNNSAATIGWVSTKRSSSSVTAPANLVASRVVSTPKPALTNGVNVQFAGGQLTIHAGNASLSEVLYQIQKKTGAEVAIPSGTEQERVAADFGPGTPSQVLAELLNGSGLNFVVIGSASDPNALRSVILTRKSGGVDPPRNFAQYPTQPVDAENIDQPNPEPAVAPAAPPQSQSQQIPINDPPPPPLQN